MPDNFLPDIHTFAYYPISDIVKFYYIKHGRIIRSNYPFSRVKVVITTILFPIRRRFPATVP